MKKKGEEKSEQETVVTREMKTILREYLVVKCFTFPAPCEGLGAL